MLAKARIEIISSDFLVQKMITFEEAAKICRNLAKVRLTQKRLNSLNSSELDEYLRHVVKISDDFFSQIEIAHILIDGRDPLEEKCRICGKWLHWKKERQNKICNNCIFQTEEFKTKMSNFSKQLWQRQDYREKIASTCQKKFGTRHPWSSSEVRCKIKKTNIAKFGTEICSKAKSVKEKMKKTLKSKTVEEKIEILKKRLKACSTRDYSHIKELRHQKFLETIKSWSDYVVPMFKDDELKRIRDGIEYKWRCTKCGLVFSAHIHKTSHVEAFKYLPRCPKCFPKLNGESKLEKEVFEFVKKYCLDAQRNDRRLIHPYELDIIIPSKKIAVEVNGDFWHSIEYNGEKAWKKTQEKLEKCNSLGWRLVIIWENQWKNGDVKQRLEEILLSNERFFGQEIKLDKELYNCIDIEGYAHIKDEEPELIAHGNWHSKNLGWSIWVKI